MRKYCFLISILVIAFSTTVEAEQSQGEVGTFALHIVKQENTEVLYRINTKTGEVWCYAERAILNAKDLLTDDKEIDGMNKLIADSKSRGLNVYTQPFWCRTDESPQKQYSIH